MHYYIVSHILFVGLELKDLPPPTRHTTNCASLTTHSFVNDTRKIKILRPHTYRSFKTTMAGPSEKLKQQYTSAASNNIKILTKEEIRGSNNKMKKTGTSEEQTPRISLTTATVPLVASLSRVKDLKLKQNKKQKQDTKQKRLSPKTKQFKSLTLATLDLKENALQTLNREKTQSSTTSPPSFLKEYDVSFTAIQEEEEENKEKKEEEEEGDTATGAKRKTSAVTEFFMGQDNNDSNRGDSMASMSAAHNKNRKKGSFVSKHNIIEPKSPTMRHRLLSLTKDAAGEDASISSAGDLFSIPKDQAVTTTNGLLILVPPLLSSHQLSSKKKNNIRTPARPPGAVKRRIFLKKTEPIHFSTARKNPSGLQLRRLSFTGSSRSTW